LTQGFHQPDEESMSIEELLNSTEIKYYPNPFTDMLCIELSCDLPESEFKIQIADVFGRLLKVCKLKKGLNRFVCSDLPDGLLVLQLCKDNIKLKSFKLQKLDLN
jgi:hypothetical protein